MSHVRSCVLRIYLLLLVMGCTHLGGGCGNTRGTGPEAQRWCRLAVIGDGRGDDCDVSVCGVFDDPLDAEQLEIVEVRAEDAGGRVLPYVIERYPARYASKLGPYVALIFDSAQAREPVKLQGTLRYKGARYTLRATYYIERDTGFWSGRGTRVKLEE